jgi:hypothetical protein
MKKIIRFYLVMAWKLPGRFTFYVARYFGDTVSLFVIFQVNICIVFNVV